MPRTARKRSDTGTYHVMLRGINRQTIFEDNEDYEKFLQRLRVYREECGYEIYAYCLMSNHVHLLMKEGAEYLGKIFRRIGASYVYWYNWKYSRTGHLFQDRYKSEVVENDRYFLTVLRYIHQNPIKARMADDIGEYPWSSYNEYIGQADICATHFALSIFSDDIKTAIEQFSSFNKEENIDKCLDYEETKRLNDIEARELIKDIANIQNPNALQRFEKDKRDLVIKHLKNNGLSIRQIERLTGISYGLIRGV